MISQAGLGKLKTKTESGFKFRISLRQIRERYWIIRTSQYLLSEKGCCFLLVKTASFLFKEKRDKENLSGILFFRRLSLSFLKTAQLGYQERSIC